VAAAAAARAHFLQTDFSWLRAPLVLPSAMNVLFRVKPNGDLRLSETAAATAAAETAVLALFAIVSCQEQFVSLQT
jgi:hypothetical protein